MKTLENLNLYPYAIEVEVNGVTHNVLPVLGDYSSLFRIDIEALVPKDVVLISSEVCSKPKYIIDNQGNLEIINVDIISSVGVSHGYVHSGLNIYPMGAGKANEFIDFYQKMAGNKLVITLTPKQYLDLFTFDIAYEIVPK